MKKGYGRLFAAATTIVLVTSPAFALTLTNQDDKDNTVLVDEGKVETKKVVPAGKSLSLKDVCKNGCGLTGPRGFTRMANQGDKISIKNGDVWGSTGGS